MASVHPHVRGEDRFGDVSPQGDTGSPPRTWGRLCGFCLRRPLRRFTPTYVGKTQGGHDRRGASPVHPHVRGEDLSARKLYGLDAVHPHVRGEDIVIVVRPVVLVGSPPRTWGRRPTRGILRGVRPVHPHVRGEDGHRVGRLHPAVGSPPRTWGRPVRGAARAVPHRFTPTYVGKTPPLHLLGDRWRFTPTYVGKTWQGCRSCGPSPVHPHVRGEDRIPSRQGRPVRGSPPRTWGRPGRCVGGDARVRFTPTYVGKTSEGALRSKKYSVHPHVRGEDSVPGWRWNRRYGSPPRTWGRRVTGTVVFGAPPVHPHVRGEDARAAADRPAAPGSPPRTWGRPACPCGHRGSGPVHPHVRGEDKKEDIWIGENHGSPPRTWGRLQDGDAVLLAERFTPTYVGKTAFLSSCRRYMAVHPHVRGEDS